MKRLLSFWFGPPCLVDNGSPWGGIGFWSWGLLVNWQALWVGVHYSQYSGRVCVNLLPCVTLWVCAPGGVQP